MLWAIKNLGISDIRQMEKHGIMEISHRKDNQPVSVDTKIDDVMAKALEQNFIPVVDDRNTFIGIITRKAVYQYCMEKCFKQPEQTAKKEAVSPWSNRI